MTAHNDGMRIEYKTIVFMEYNEIFFLHSKIIQKYCDSDSDIQFIFPSEYDQTALETSVTAKLSELVCGKE